MARNSASAELIFSRRRRSMSEWFALRSCSRDMGLPVGPTLVAAVGVADAEGGPPLEGLDWMARLPRDPLPGMPRELLPAPRVGSYSLSPASWLLGEAELSGTGEREPTSRSWSSR